MDVMNDHMDVNALLKEAVGKTVRNEEWKYTRATSLLSNAGFQIPNAKPIPNAESNSNYERSEYPFDSLVDAVAEDVEVIRVTKDASPFTFHVSLETDTARGDTILAKRVEIIVEAGASAFIVERHSATGDNSALHIVQTHVVAEEGSVVEHVKIIDSNTSLRHVGHTTAEVKAHAKFTSHVHCLNADWVRNDLNVKLVEPNAEAYLYGVSVLNAEQFADNHTVVDHMVPHCHSEELYKGVYDGKSIGVFNGKIFVRPHAQKTTAYQSCKSILVSPRAQVNAKPQLEIWADDVKCSHGATSGQLDEESLFYLQSRGIGYNEARALLTYAHAADVADHITNDDVRTQVERRIAEKLGASW